MNKKVLAILFTLISLVWLLQAVNAQDVPRMALEMSELTPGLLSIAPDQMKNLQNLVYQSVLEESRLTADLKIATAQIERLLTEPEVDLKMLKQRLEERYHLAAQADFVHIQKAIEALKLLTHEQHVKAFPAFRKWLEQKRQRNNQQGEDQKL